MDGPTSRADAQVGGPTSRADAQVGGPTSRADAQVDGEPVPLEGGVIFQPGTQPKTLTSDIRSPSLCENCHGIYAPYSANDTWKGTMMANAARDPLFYAALTVANQDITNSGEICVRCHSPRAWLFGRSMPPLVEKFEPDDLEGVQCDFCHRITDGPAGETFIGNARYFVADDFVRRGPIRDALAPHDWRYSSYHEESRLCGLCHDVSNPFQNGFAIERTFTEWQTSAFASEGKSCQSCHLPSERGPACGAPGMPERDVHRHELAGGNYWMPLVLAGEYPELGRGAAYEATAKNATAMLERAATVAISAPNSITAGQSLSFSVRVTNQTGHKLPTGYPEGRRMWLEAIVIDASGKELFHSGAYDEATARRGADPQLRTYEVRLAAAGNEGFHFVLQDELVQDNRIPPRGFEPRADTRPVGRDYPIIGDAGPLVLANWDDAPYSLSVPSDASGSLEIRTTLWYQTTSREYVESLRDGNHADNHGMHMHDLWEKYDRAPPFAVARQTTTLDVLSAPEPKQPATDASLSNDANGSIDGPPEDGPPTTSESASGDGGSGCTCQSAALQTGTHPGAGFILIWMGIFQRFYKKKKGQR